MEKVTYGLRCMCYGDVECKECPYARDGSGWHDCRSNCAKDFLAMLKEQETTNICHKRNARIFSCEKCGYGLDDIYLTNERDYPIEPAYCPNCGRKVVDDA